MIFSAKILADSVNNGNRITTFELTFPRSILAEWRTHRMNPGWEAYAAESINAASSRAIPVGRMIENIENYPFIPDFHSNQKGMQVGEGLAPADVEEADQIWIELRDTVIKYCDRLRKLNIHKGYVNRPLEPWMFCKIISTATDWSNLFALRTHKQAEPSFQRVANLAYSAYKVSEPTEIKDGWHLPFLTDYDDLVLPQYCHVIDHLVEKNVAATYDDAEVIYPESRLNNWLLDISVGRCARISYITHDGKRNVLEDIRLAVQLSCSNPGHWSPFEHIARPARMEEMSYNFSDLEVYEKFDGTSKYGRSISEGHRIRPRNGVSGYCGNLKGWKSYRKHFSNENITEFNYENQ